MNWIELKDPERFLRFASEHGNASFLADREAGDSFFVDCAASRSALVPDVQEYHMGCIDDYKIGLKELWKDSAFAEPDLDLLVRIVAAAALRHLYIYQREMYGGRRIAPTREQLLEIAKMKSESISVEAPPVSTVPAGRSVASPGETLTKPELDPVFYEF